MSITPNPDVTFNKLKTVKGRQSIIRIKKGAINVLFLADYLGDSSTLDIGRYEAPGAENGPAYTPETWLRGRAELFKFRTKEVKKVIETFGSLTFHESGAAAVLLVRDPNDVANHAALLSEEDFPCSVYRDQGEVAHSPTNPSEITIVIESHKDGVIEFEPDGEILTPEPTPEP